MNKPLLIFIILAFLFFVAVATYDKYCESKPNGCKQEQYNDDDLGPVKGIDW